MNLIFFLIFGGCGVDADLDGFDADEDCDDAEPFVHPGAPDTPGDGIDGDCVGGDPPYAFLGTWSFTDFYATYSGINLLVPGTTTGTLVVSDTMEVVVDFVGTLDEAVAGSAISFALHFDGVASPVDTENGVDIYAEGHQYDEEMHIDWGCAVDTGTLYCDGELKAFEGSLNAEAELVGG